MSATRVRFAPSPTGALHIGGIRTALYNYLFARQTGGTFILRIEDTDQNRYVPGAEAYILESLEWLGLRPDEGPGIGDGPFGPYRQSERKEIYLKYALELVAAGKAYYAFDTPEALEEMRLHAQEKGETAFKYDHTARLRLVNGLTLPEAEVRQRIAAGAAWVIRLKVPENETVLVEDLVRGTVQFQSNELDDKVMLKSDGMPTYHLANIVDDHLMQITHVIRGEEWLPSTAHHVLLYQAFGWSPPKFAHLPLILKPTGQGKLSKRDGVKLGIPVFPISWKGEREEDSFTGFREAGFLPEAVINFLAFLGWNPGTDQEMFRIGELIAAFDIEKIGRSGARFDYDKARWFNQQYILQSGNAPLAAQVRPLVEAKGYFPEQGFLEQFCGLMKERAVLLDDFWVNGAFLLEDFTVFDEKTVAKKWNAELREQILALPGTIEALPATDAASVQGALDQYMQTNSLKAGDLLPVLRIALIGTTRGPGVADMIALLGPVEVRRRILRAAGLFDAFLASS
ncbi:MAG: glutamate--tRNA ligase [Saprospiraceae bacterium]